MPALQFGSQGLLPAFAPDLAVTRTFCLPYGGSYVQGQALGVIGGAEADEVVTLTVTGSPTGGTFAVTFTGASAYQAAGIAHNASLAAFKAALEAAVPEWKDNVTVTGTPGSSYVVTFGGILAKQRIGGTFSAAGSFTGGTSPAATWARTTRGSAGAAQADVYSQSANNRVDGFLQYDTTLTPGGALVPAAGGPSVALNQPFQPSVYVAGIFSTLAGDPAGTVVGVDANALTLGKLTKVQGNYVHLI